MVQDIVGKYIRKIQLINTLKALKVDLNLKASTVQYYLKKYVWLKRVRKAQKDL